MNTGGLRNQATRPTPPQRALKLPRLRAVAPQPRQQPTTTFAALVVVVMGAGLVGLLLLNIAMQNASFHLAALDEQVQDLHVQEQALDLEVDRLGSPERLAEQAAELGMVPNPNPVFLDMGSGKIISDPQPARPGTGLVDDFKRVPEATRKPQPTRKPQQTSPENPKPQGEQR